MVLDTCSVTLPPRDLPEEIFSWPPSVRTRKSVATWQCAPLNPYPSPPSPFLPALSSQISSSLWFLLETSSAEGSGKIQKRRKTTRPSVRKSELAMDGNVGISAPADQATPGWIKQTGGGEREGGGGVEPSRGAGGGGEAASMMVDSTSTEWTDEKHSLYLNSMEESFVNQLYNHGFGSNNPLGWMSRTQKDRNSLASHAENIYSGQFKVLRGGCWGEVKFERPRTRADIQNETRILSRNPWIQHFRSASNDKCVDSLSSEHLKSDDIANRATNTGRQSHVIADCGETGLNQQPACCTHLCHQYSVCCHTEVSDQNFVDDFEEAKRSRVCKKKRTRTTFSDARDQVVPFGKTTAISSADERISSLKGKNVECSSTKASKFG